MMYSCPHCESIQLMVETTNTAHHSIDPVSGKLICAYSVQEENSRVSCWECGADLTDDYVIDWEQGLALTPGEVKK